MMSAWHRTDELQELGPDTMEVDVPVWPDLTLAIEPAPRADRQRRSGVLGDAGSHGQLHRVMVK